MAYVYHIHKCSIRDITKEVAAAVVKEAIEEDLAEGYREMDARELQKLSQVFLLFIQQSISNLCSYMFFRFYFIWCGS